MRWLSDKSAPPNPSIGDLFFNPIDGTTKMWDGNFWCSFMQESKEQQLDREVKQLREFLSYKQISDDELNDFIESRRLVERMQE